MLDCSICRFSMQKFNSKFSKSPLESARGLKLDERVAAMMMLRFSPLEQILSDIYPRLYRLNDLALPTCCDESSWPRPHFCSKEHAANRELFVRRLVDDRTESTHSYNEFLLHLN
ncbi:unnamed protein product [Caenorhabditis angaria]|uniref:Uncharacterized protein n=1 Tax=Caenorhabditis angaria TaxID=860376 RepID=A0A9P1MXA5_9PELO|nr:unnamed protein product [Caenorhabditis angaria]